MAPVLSELAKQEQKLAAGRRHALLGRGSLHASVISGGQEASSYPARCRLTGEWRTVPGQNPLRDLEELVARSGVEAKLSIPFEAPPIETSFDEEIVGALRRAGAGEIGAMPYWADSALISAAGIPTVLYGPHGGGAHAADEWVDLSSVVRVRDVLVETARLFCGT